MLTRDPIDAPTVSTSVSPPGPGPDLERPPVPPEVDQAYLLRTIADDDGAGDRLDAHLRDEGRWWSALRALERARLVTVAVVGPHRRRWPWVVVDLTAKGRRRLDGDR